MIYFLQCSTLAYYLLYIAFPRMSSHCYKLFNLFFLDFSIKPLFWNRGCYIVVTKSVWRMLRHCYKFSSSGRYIIATNQVSDFHSTSTLPSSYTYIPCTYSSSISRVSFSYPKYINICSTGTFFFIRISFSLFINSSSSCTRFCSRCLYSSNCIFSSMNCF